MTNTTHALLAAVATAALLLTGCAGQRSADAPSGQNASQASGQAAPVSPATALKGVTARGLTAAHPTTIDVTTLPKGVAATAGVSFQSDAGVTLTLLTFKDGTTTQAARRHYAQANQRVYATDTRLLTAGRWLSRGWFEKYQRAIFRQ
ncbi:hypothetical protein [Lacticaseibacillus parakribbianus]|uniref:hypothetical protein n=1 Tax=Lacticaseibacillus parakribbianus TaxID=2970927 RepID=UPI0021CB1E31|nr:hypothetical protein [Lacticaseibacillus parakribbianus]